MRNSKRHLYENRTNVNYGVLLSRDKEGLRVTWDLVVMTNAQQKGKVHHFLFSNALAVLCGKEIEGV